MLLLLQFLEMALLVEGLQRAGSEGMLAFVGTACLAGSSAQELQQADPLLRAGWNQQDHEVLQIGANIILSLLPLIVGDGATMQRVRVRWNGRRLQRDGLATGSAGLDRLGRGHGREMLLLLDDGALLSTCW